MSTILFFIVSLIVQAIALKLALGLLGQAGASNKMSTALTVVGILQVALVVTSFIPIVGWFIQPLVWLLVIMAVYKIGFFKTLGVALVQFVVQILLKWLLALIGLAPAFMG